MEREREGDNKCNKPKLNFTLFIQKQKKRKREKNEDKKNFLKIFKIITCKSFSSFWYV